MERKLKTRPPLVYQLALLLALGVFVYLLASGRFLEFFRRFADTSEFSPSNFNWNFATGLIWVAGIGPLVYLAWELGNQKTAARREGFAPFAGFGPVLRIALTGSLPAEESAEAQLPLRDRPVRAFVLGTLWGAFSGSLPLVALPFLRQPKGVAFCVGIGVFVGAVLYSHLRAGAYLVDEPEARDPFREYRLLNPQRYEPAGRWLVVFRIVVTVLAMLWMLVGGPLLLGQKDLPSYPP